MNDSDYSTVHLLSYDLERLPPRSRALSNAILAKTERLSIRLIGHRSKKRAKDPWHVSPEESEDENPDEQEEKEEVWDDWMTAGPVVEGSVRNQLKYIWHAEERVSLASRKRIDIT